MAPQLWVPVHGEGTLTREWQSLPAHTHPIQERILARGEYSLAFPPNRTNEGPQGHSLGKPQIRQVCEKSFFPLETMMLHVLKNMPFSEGILHSLTFSKKAHCPTQPVSLVLQKAALCFGIRYIPLPPLPSEYLPCSPQESGARAFALDVGTQACSWGTREGGVLDITPLSRIEQLA